MHRGRFIFAAMLAFCVTGAYAANPPAPININLDFSKPADQKMMMLNGDASWTNNRLELTNALSQAGSAFLSTSIPPTADYLATFQFEVMSDNGAAPADGLAFVAQGVGPDKVGGGGGGLGYTGNTFGTYSYAVEFNTYSGQGLGNGMDTTVAWDAFGQREKFNQTAWPQSDNMGTFVDNGVYTAQVLVQPSQITVTVSGGKNNLKPTVVMQTTPLAPGLDVPWYSVLEPKPIFFGFTGGTGGADTIQDILNLHFQSPAPSSKPAPTTTPAPTTGQ